MYNNYNPYFQQQRFQPTMMQQPFMNTDAQTQYNATQFVKPASIQGKQVDSIDVVKATDVPFDGSISYFPLTDGTAIVTKQLQTDGTSKLVIFKPVSDEKKEIKYLTRDDLDKALNSLNLSDIDEIKEEIKEIKKQLKKKGD